MNDVYEKIHGFLVSKIYHRILHSSPHISVDCSVAFPLHQTHSRLFHQVVGIVIMSEVDPFAQS